MDPLTALGAVATVAQLAATALSLSKTLYSLGAAIASASDDIQILADDLKTFSQSLTLLSRLLEDSKSWYSDDIYLLTAKILRDCAELYVKIDKILVKLGGNRKTTWKLRVKFVVYREGQIRKLLNRLRDMKGTLATILMSLQVDLQLSLLNISSSSKIQRPADTPLEPETLQTLKQAQEAVEAGGFLPKYTVHSEQVVLSSEGVELSSTRYEINSQIQCSNIVGTPSAAYGKPFPTLSRGLDSEKTPFSNPFSVTQSFAVQPSLDQGFPPVPGRDTEMTSNLTSKMQDLCLPGDRFQNTGSMNHKQGLLRDGRHSTDTKSNGSPSRSLKSSSSTESFKSAMSLQEEDLNLARKVKAVQSVMHAFRTALEILNNLVDRRIHDKYSELYFAAKKLEDSLDNGNKAIYRKHILHFKQHGQSYIQLFTEPRSAKLQSISSNLMTEVVMKLHEYSAEHEDLQVSCFEALHSTSENTCKRVLQYLNRVVYHLPVNYALGLADEEESVADEDLLSAEIHPQFTAWPHPNENTSPKLALPIRHHTDFPYLHKDQLSPATSKSHTTPSSLPFIGYSFKRVDSEGSRSLNHETQQISPSTNSDITQFSRVGFSIPTSLDAVQAPIGTTNARDSDPWKLPRAISSPSASENKKPMEDGIDEPLKNLGPKAQGRKRTKTGCLTCRKRLIKCGDERPTCQNCTKSKRQCEGYNQRVVFKDPLNAYRPPLSTPSHISFPGPNYGQAVSPDGQRHLISQHPASGQNLLPIAPRPFGLRAEAAGTTSISAQQPTFGPLDPSSSEDESMPPASPTYAFSLSEKKQIVTTSFNSKQEPPIPQPEQQAIFNYGQQRMASSLPPASGLDVHYERFESTGSTIYEPPHGFLPEIARAKYLENRATAEDDELLSRARIQEDEYYYRRDVMDVGARRDSVSDESDSSDYVASRRIIRKERSRNQSPHHKRHLAEGALAGVGVAALVSNHRDKPGDGPEHRGRKVLGGAALGAVGAEVATRARSRSRSRSSSPSAKMSKIRATTGFPGAVEYYRLTAGEEDVAATKQQIRLMKQQDISSTRNALRIAAQAEETSRATLARLGAQGERIYNTEKNLDLAANHNHIAEDKAKELKTLNKSMFAVHVSNPFTASSRKGLRELSITQPSGAPGGSGGGNHALQDYQMQLMLLEQQNKKRLMMARQEQDDIMPRADGPGGQGDALGAVVPDGQPFQDTLPAVQFCAFNLKAYGDEDVNGEGVAFPDGLAQTERDSFKNEPLEEQTTSSAPRPAPITSASDEDAPLYVNKKQFHRILKRRMARQKLEEKLKAQSSRTQKSWHRSLPLRRPRGPDGRFLTQEQIAEQETSRWEELESQIVVQQVIANEPTDASSTTKQASQPDYISSPDYQPTDIKLSSLPGQTELTSAYPALSQFQLSKLWWQTYISLHTTDPTSFRTVAEELRSELGIFATGSLSDELICKRISTNIKRIGTALHDDKLNIDGMMEIMEMRGTAVRIMTTVELQLGLEVATLGWSCAWTFLAVHEYAFASSQCEVPETMQMLKTSFTHLQDIVAIIARYAVMENLYHQTGSALSLSLKPEYQSLLVALSTTVLQFFATSYELGRKLSQINIGGNHGEEELMKRCDQLVNEIKKMDRECQGFRVLVDMVREETDDSGNEDVNIEDLSNEGWEMVDAGVVGGYGGAGAD